MKTTIAIEIDHIKPLPKDAMRVVENRINDYLYAHGVDVKVEVKAVCESERSVGMVFDACDHGAGLA